MHRWLQTFWKRRLRRHLEVLCRTILMYHCKLFSFSCWFGQLIAVSVGIIASSVTVSVENGATIILHLGLRLGMCPRFLYIQPLSWPTNTHSHIKYIFYSKSISFLRCLYLLFLRRIWISHRLWEPLLGPVFRFCISSRKPLVNGQFLTASATECLSLNLQKNIGWISYLSVYIWRLLKHVFY